MIHGVGYCLYCCIVFASLFTISSCCFQCSNFGVLVVQVININNKKHYALLLPLINEAIFRYELCFNGEKVIKAATAPHVHGAETGRIQTYNSHLTNGERNAVDGESTVVDIFRWSRCKRPLPQKSMQTIGIPLPLEHVEVIFPCHVCHALSS